MSEPRIGSFTFTIPVTAINVSLDQPVNFDKKTNKMVVDLDKGKYSLTSLLNADHPQLAAAKAEAAKVAKAKWPGRPLSEVKFPFQNGDTQADKRLKKAAAKGKKAEVDYMRGKVLLPAHAYPAYPPDLTDATKGFGNVLNPKQKFYSGAQVLVEVFFKAYEKTDEVKGEEVNQDGVTCYLNKVSFAGEGPKIGGGGGRSSADAFKDYAGSVSDENPLDPDEMVMD